MMQTRKSWRKRRGLQPQAELCEPRRLLTANFSVGTPAPNSDEAIAGIAAELAMAMNFRDSAVSTADSASKLVVTTHGAPFSFRPVSATAAVESPWSAAEMAKAGEPIQLAAHVSPASARGSVAFYANDAKVGEASVVDGEASLNVDDLPPGDYQFSARFQGADGFASSASEIVAADLSSSNKQSTFTEAFTDNSPSESGDRVNLAAFVRLGGVGSIGSAGTVSFYSDGQFLGTGDVVNGLATLSVSNLELGKHKITAKFNGTDSLASSVSLPIIQNVVSSQAKRTFIEVFTDNASVAADKGITFSAYVRMGPTEGAGSRGSVTFLSDGQELGTVDIADSVARLRVANLSVGDHRITARFNGVGDLQPSVAEAIEQKIVPVAAPIGSPGGGSLQSVPKATAVRLSAPDASYPPGAVVPLTAAVLQGDRALEEGGFVEFFSNGRLMGLVPVIGGEAVFETTDLTVGQHSITAYYNGDRDFAPSLSDPLNVQISQNAKISTFSWLWVEPDRQAGGSNYIVRAFVSDRMAAGSIRLLNDGRQISQADLSDGIAEFRVALASGEHSLQAIYSGDSKYGSSASIIFNRSL